MSLVDDALAKLQCYPRPADWAGELFLLPEVCIRILCDHMRQYDIRTVLELGTGFGTSTCVIAACLKEMGGGRLITVDRHLHQPINVETLLDHCGLDRSAVEVVVDPSGYNWMLADALGKGLLKRREIDLCFIDGAHEWEPDALAFHLVRRFIRPGGWLVLDDLDFRLRQIEDRLEPGAYPDRELDAFQMRMVFELLVRTDRGFVDCHEFPEGRLGWARRIRRLQHPKGWTDRMRRSFQ